jgi:hypothetical protein
VRDVVAEVVEPPTPAANAPGPFRYANEDSLLRLLQDAGFMSLEVHNWQGSLAVGGGLGAADAASFTLSTFSVADAVAQADEDSQMCVRQTLTERFSNHLDDGRVWLDAAVHIIAGCR